MATSIPLTSITLPGHRAPAAGFEAPFEMLGACHERVERMLGLLAKLQQHVLLRGWDESVASAARDVMRYFDQAAPLHHEDEERHVFPPLLAGEDAALRLIVQSLQQDHRDMEVAWAAAREVLASVAQAPAPGWAHFSPLETATLTDFTRLYNRHLREEDGLVYPAARAGLSPEALEAMSADMMRRRGLEPG
ncbi:hemerythrin domain-containing protein [Hydrogenophaga sp.]|uniref:hemerythrin domain-containing protein n=1 Tax=Hydrogenophaga sp. TaxID=1904254 RepID=UPI002732BE4F|nr:hemerythrin domain-containing protein [Hydrogenophaga sp.]MDP2987535.1 hemerythrin domain-containing protein [Hydrogenophaga sp.]MDP3349875.1 hemerythrin domain-containing protein [Hydrogenophaga sp.]MDZ4399244.1 hemerythrin domain-containing protein [Hydrogenophaga sp.]